MGNMKYYVAEYKLCDGAHEYTEHGAFASRTFETAMKRAVKGKRIFNYYGWVAICRFERIEETPKPEYKVLKKYLLTI
jgi:hypothetical protein